MVIVAELNVSFAPMIVAFGASRTVERLEAQVTPIKPEVVAMESRDRFSEAGCSSTERLRQCGGEIAERRRGGRVEPIIDQANGNPGAGTVAPGLGNVAAVNKVSGVCICIELWCRDAGGYRERHSPGRHNRGRIQTYVTDHLEGCASDRHEVDELPPIRVRIIREPQMAFR
jgi:hypothetical protein